MDRKFLLLFFFSALFLQSCRESEISTDKEVEENEEVGVKQRSGRKHLAVVQFDYGMQVTEVSKMTFLTPGLF